MQSLRELIAASAPQSGLVSVVMILAVVEVGLGAMKRREARAFLLELADTLDRPATPISEPPEVTQAHEAALRIFRDRLPRMLARL